MSRTRPAALQGGVHVTGGIGGAMLCVEDFLPF